MKFVRENENEEKYVDGIFSISQMASADPKGINGTLGCLNDEEGKLYTFNSVYKVQKTINDKDFARYSSPSGQKEYLKQCQKHFLEDRITLPLDMLATPGGTGALYLAIKLCLKENDTLCFPSVSWDNYSLMCKDFNLNSVTYNLDTIDDLFKTIDTIENKLFLIINSPCENPTGRSYSYKEWEQIIDKLNSLKKEVILCLDMAYIDYSNDNKDFLNLFNNLNDNVLLLIASSCSKSFSYYGSRLGTLYIVNKNIEVVDKFTNLATRLARTTYSNCNSGGQATISKLLKEYVDEYQKELKEARSMLKKRAELFILQAKENDLPLYDYTDGFFITLKIEDEQKLDEIFERFLRNHIYTVKVNKGIRIGICSLTLKQIDGLANKMKELFI